MKESTSALRSFVVRYAGKMNWPGILFCLAPLLVFLLVACLLRANPFQWVPLWSDEAGWYVQVNSVVKFGAPLGYTGYNETHAAVGTFGPWGAFMIWAMALFGKVFGWHYCSPLFMNMVYWMLANFVFLLFTRPARSTLMKLACYGRPSNLGCTFPAGLSWNYIMDGHAVSKPRYIVTGRDMQSFGGYRKTYEDDLICIFERIRGKAK